MFIDVLTQLDLSKNEAKIYETLLKHGEASAGRIATKAGINRRNAYDSLARLIEKGYVFESIHKNESLYQAVDPKKLGEIIEEKQSALSSIMPHMEKLYGSTPHTNEVFIYHGIEGFKNHFRDVVKAKQDYYVIGGRAVIADPDLRSFVENAFKQMRKNGVGFRVLFDPEIEEVDQEILRMDVPGRKYRFLPRGFSTEVTIAIFGDYTVLYPNAKIAVVEEDMTFTVVVNPAIANAFRTWWKLLWEMSVSPASEAKEPKSESRGKRK